MTMTTTFNCTFIGDRDAALVDYLYGEGSFDERGAFEAHVEQCRVCRTEIEALGGVRRVLKGWMPPEPRRALESIEVGGPRLVASSPGASWEGLRTMPFWAQAAAAVLCVGVATGAANVRVAFRPDGVSVSTGWLRSEAPAVPPASTQSADAPWRAELAALDRALRAEIETRSGTVPAVVRTPVESGDDSLVRQVRSLIAQSEQRQQRELALRIGDALNDLQVQRRADLAKIDRTIGLVQNSTGMEVMRQRDMLNSLAVRVSTQR
jgi:hypothetical protein